MTKASLERAARMSDARDRVIQYVKGQIAFYSGRGPDYDLLVSELGIVMRVIEKETKW